MLLSKEVKFVTLHGRYWHSAKLKSLRWPGGLDVYKCVHPRNGVKKMSEWRLRFIFGVHPIIFSGNGKALTCCWVFTQRGSSQMYRNCQITRGEQNEAATPRRWQDTLGLDWFYKAKQSILMYIALNAWRLCVRKSMKPTSFDKSKNPTFHDKAGGLPNDLPRGQPLSQGKRQRLQRCFQH